MSVPSSVPNENRGVIDSQNFLSRNIVARLVRPPQLNEEGPPATEDRSVVMFYDRHDGGKNETPYNFQMDLDGVDSVSRVLKYAKKKTNATFVASYVKEFPNNTSDGTPQDQSVAANKSYFQALKYDKLYGLPLEEVAEWEWNTTNRSALYVASAKRFISLPYKPSFDSSLWVNTIANSTSPKPLGSGPNATTYMWSVKYPKDYNPSTDYLYDPRPLHAGYASYDGIVVPVQARYFPKPLFPLQLDPNAFDPHVPKNALDKPDVGAFCLTFSLHAGEASTSTRSEPWSLTIRFGEVTIRLQEGDKQFLVSFANAKEKEVIPVALYEEMGKKNISNYREFELCVIPVTGGLLLSNGMPHPDKKNNIEYVKGRDFEIEEYINDVMTRPQRKPKNKRKKVDQEIPRPFPLNVYPPDYKTADDIPVDPPRRDAFGIRVEDAEPINMKGPIEVTYHRCGGYLLFQPIFFVPNLRLHSLNTGDPTDAITDIYKLPLPPCDADNDILEDCDSGTNNPPRRVRDINKDKMYYMPVDELPLSKNTRIFPISAWPVNYGIQEKSRAYVLPGSNSDIRTDVLLDIRRRDPVPVGTPDPNADPDAVPADRQIAAKYIRKPVEIFGYVMYRYTPSEPPKDRDKKDKQNVNWTLRNGERMLYLNEIPEQRIRSIQVSRNLEGSSGSITWDRYDPVTGLAPRPDQFAASVSLAVEGGNDVTPGNGVGNPTIFWTGLAIGNAVVNTEQENTVKTNLFGREFKLGEHGLHIINAPYFDAWDHIKVMKWLTQYAGVPLNNLAKPYRLPSSFAIQAGASVVDFTSGTPVWGGIAEVCKLAGTVAYFDRFGKLTYIEQDRTTGTNWVYPDAMVESYNDEPDLSTMANSLVVSSLVADQGVPRGADLQTKREKSRPIMIGLRLKTYPEFSFDKMVHYPVNAVFDTVAEFNRVALRIAREISRPRAAGSVTIPGNANMELLDTFNERWLITSISHSLDTQAKSFRTSLGLEYIQTGDLQGIASYLPLPTLFNTSS